MVKPRSPRSNLIESYAKKAQQPQPSTQPQQPLAGIGKPVAKDGRVALAEARAEEYAEKAKAQQELEKQDGFKETIQRMYNVLGSPRMEPAEIKERLEQLAKTDPEKYMELVGSAKELVSKDVRPFKSLRSFFDIGERNSPWSMAQYIMGKAGSGAQSMTHWSDMNAKQSSDMAIQIDKSTPAQMPAILRRIKDLYDRELRVYGALPDEAAYEDKLAAVEGYLTQYKTFWDMCTKKIEEYKRSPDKLVEFLDAYVREPLAPMPSEQQAFIKALVQKYREGYNLTDAAVVARMSYKINKGSGH